MSSPGNGNINILARIIGMIPRKRSIFRSSYLLAELVDIYKSILSLKKKTSEYFSDNFPTERKQTMDTMPPTVIAMPKYSTVSCSVQAYSSMHIGVPKL
jgi:hypothetical protein